MKINMLSYISIYSEFNELSNGVKIYRVFSKNNTSCRHSVYKQCARLKVILKYVISSVSFYHLAVF